MSPTALLDHRKTSQRREDSKDRLRMRRASQGDRAALEELYNTYYRRVYASCVKTCRNSDDAIEATQQAFLNVFRHITERDTEIKSFRDYLFMSSRNICLKIIASRARTVPSDDLIDQYQPSSAVEAGQDPQRSALIFDQQAIVRRALSSLPDRQRKALELFEIEGLSYEEVGTALSLRANAVAQLIMRTRQRLAREVRRAATASPAAVSQTCTDAMTLMSKKIEGRLSDTESAWLLPHLRSCQTCKTNLAVMEEVGASYRVIAPPAVLAFEQLFTSRAEASLMEGCQGGQRLSQGNLLRCRLATTAAALIGAAAMVLMLVSGLGRGESGEGVSRAAKKSPLAQRFADRYTVRGQVSDRPAVDIPGSPTGETQRVSLTVDLNFHGSEAPPLFSPSVESAPAGSSASVAESDSTTTDARLSTERCRSRSCSSRSQVAYTSSARRRSGSTAPKHARLTMSVGGSTSKTRKSRTSSNGSSGSDDRSRSTQTTRSHSSGGRSEEATQPSRGEPSTSAPTASPSGDGASARAGTAGEPGTRQSAPGSDGGSSTTPPDPCVRGERCGSSGSAR